MTGVVDTSTAGTSRLGVGIDVAAAVVVVVIVAIAISPGDTVIAAPVVVL